MDRIETLPHDETCAIYRIECQTCGTTMSLNRGQFPICDDCLKDLREIIKERRLEKEKAEFKLKVNERCAELERK